MMFCIILYGKWGEKSVLSAFHHENKIVVAEKMCPSIADICKKKRSERLRYMPSENAMRIRNKERRTAPKTKLTSWKKPVKSRKTRYL